MFILYFIVQYPTLFNLRVYVWCLFTHSITTMGAIHITSTQQVCWAICILKYLIMSSYWAGGIFAISDGSSTFHEMITSSLEMRLPRSSSKYDDHAVTSWPRTENPGSIQRSLSTHLLLGVLYKRKPYLLGLFFCFIFPDWSNHYLIFIFILHSLFGIS